jgi:hypothetical protein
MYEENAEHWFTEDGIGNDNVVPLIHPDKKRWLSWQV